MRNLIDLMHNIPVLVNPVTPLLQWDILQSLYGHFVMQTLKHSIHSERTKWWIWNTKGYVSIKTEFLLINSMHNCTCVCKSNDAFGLLRYLANAEEIINCTWFTLYCTLRYQAFPLVHKRSMESTMKITFSTEF